MGSFLPALSSLVASTISGWRGRASSNAAKTFNASALFPCRERKLPALHHAQRGRIELVGALEALGGLLLLAGDVEDQGSMQLLEDGVPIRAGELVDGVGRLLRLGRV